MSSPSKVFKPSSPSKPVHSPRDADAFEKRSVPFLLKKALREQDDEWDKDELLDVIHWLRQIVAIACGLTWGLIPLRGFWAFFGYIVVNQLTVFSWWRGQRIDEEEYGGTQTLMGEGLPPSIGLFLFLWIITFTAFGSTWA